MFNYYCLNKISSVGTSCFTENFTAVEEMNQADAILVRSAAMHEMEFDKNLKAIARAGAGVNNIPLDRCAKEGIVVFNTPGANANAVKELVIAGLFLGSRDVVGGMEWVKQNKDLPDLGKQVEKAKSAFAGQEIKGKKLGVIGLGAIGVEVANAAVALGMEVYGYDPYISVAHAWKMSGNVKHVRELEEIYRECDYITVHVPLMDSTKGMINKDTLAMMKDGVIILNFARDQLVSEQDLGEALVSGKVCRYVTDFPNPTVASMKNAVCIPHLGASTAEAEDNCAAMAVKQVMDFLENGNITNSVNYPNVDAGVCHTLARVGIFHDNVPNMLAQFTSVFSADGINIDNMINKSKGDSSYTVLDVDAVNETIAEKLSKIAGVRKVRIIKC